jgi:hypothetical protein
VSEGTNHPEHPSGQQPPEPTDATRLQILTDMVGIEEGGIAEYGLAIVAYLGEDGERYYGYAHAGDPPLSSTVGLLELAKRSIMNDWYQENGD